MYFTTNDGVQLYYDVQGEGRPLLMLPGWTCSTRFFDANVCELAKKFKVIRMDFRGHGESEKPEFSHRISRYAMDVKNLLDYLDVEDVCAIGWSMGASVIWSYLELFGDHKITAMVSVDQAPLQYTGPDWVWGQKGCYDAEMFVRLCKDLEYNHKGCSVGMVHNCMYRQPTEEEEKFFSEEIYKCPVYTAVEIMRDHTNLDWRDFIRRIQIPTLVCVARNSAIFDWHGSEWVGKNIQGAEIEYFENSGHMLFFEEADKFNEVVGKFASK